MRALFRLPDRGVAALTGEVHFSFVALGDAKVHTLLMGQSSTEGGSMSKTVHVLVVGGEPVHFATAAAARRYIEALPPARRDEVAYLGTVEVQS